MRTAVHWIASIAAAGLIIFLLEKFLPASIARVWLIAISGLAGVVELCRPTTKSLGTWHSRMTGSCHQCLMVAPTYA